jgi:peptide/nickel transport system permease protein
MLLFVLRRLAAGVVLLFVVSTVTFFMLNLTGQDPARQIAGPLATEDQVQARRVEMGLDQPVFVRYLNWLSAAARGDLGVSWYTSEPVNSQLGQALPATMSMVLGAILLTAVIGAVLGVWAAVRGGWLDRSLQVGSTLMQAIPNFLIALVLVFVFAIEFGLLPATGFVNPAESPSEWLASITLPVIALALGSIASIALQIRGSMLDVVEMDYVRTLRSRGLSTSSVLFKHALRNAAPAALTTLSLMFIVAISGAIVVERVFNIPGIGSLASIAAGQGDLPMVLGIVVLTVALVVLVNLLMELAQGWLNPKVRVS